MDYTEEQRVNYVAYKFSGEARQWWYTKRNSVVMELGSEEAIMWTRFKEEFVLQMWQGGTLHSELQPGQKEWYWSTWKEMMVGQGLSITTRVV
jgi:hypothetical protein